MKICDTGCTESQLSLADVKTRAVLIYNTVPNPWTYRNSWSSSLLAIIERFFIYHDVFEQVHLTGSTTAYSWVRLAYLQLYWAVWKRGHFLSRCVAAYGRSTRYCWCTVTVCRDMQQMSFNFYPGQWQYQSNQARANSSNWLTCCPLYKIGYFIIYQLFRGKLQHSAFD